jgi:hypothetical protein
MCSKKEMYDMFVYGLTMRCARQNDWMHRFMNTGNIQRHWILLKCCAISAISG